MRKQSVLLAVWLLALVACERRGEIPHPPPRETHPSAERSAQDFTADDVTGTWTVGGATPFELVLFANGQAVLPATSPMENARGRRGLWRIEGSRVLVLLAGGGSVVLSRDSSGFQVDLDKPPASGRAERLKPEKAWTAGVWRLGKDFEGNFVYASLLTDGRAFSTVNGTTEGRWEPTAEGLLCTWQDGWTDLIRRRPDGYSKESWVGNRSGATPEDISPVVRVGEAEFLISP